VKENCKEVNIRPDRVFNDKDIVVTTDNKKRLSVSAVISFVFKNRHASAFCGQVSREIEAAVLNIHKGTEEAAQREEQVDSHYKIYQTISSCNFHPLELENLLLDHSPIASDKLLTIYTEYQETFSSSWEKIKLFEWHFQRTHPDCINYELETLVTEKRLYLDRCLHIQGQYKYFDDLCHVTLSSEKKRQARGNEQHGINLIAFHQHLPSKLTADLKKDLGNVNVDADVVVCDCVEGICGSKGLHVFVGLKEDQPESHYLKSIATCARATVVNNHCDFCHSVIILSKDTLQRYADVNGQVAFYRLRNDFLLKRLKADIVFKNECAPQTDRDSDDISELCASCSEDGIEPLHWKELDILKEWKYFVPLEVQLLLESFLNRRSLASPRSPDFVSKKLRRLYIVFHNLLNLRDFRYCGVLQAVYTDRLTYGYHSVTTVFEVTSDGGLTLALTAAEQRLKHEAQTNACHYHAFVKRSLLEYRMACGVVRRQVGLQDCMLVLCMDNLVRLTVHSDPNRGESRSSQICMLPVTIMGIPADSSTVDSWHESQCDGKAGCDCMRPCVLGPDDVERVLLRLSTEEEEVLKLFNVLFTTDVANVWKDICSKIKLQPEKDPRSEQIERADDINQLEKDLSAKVQLHPDVTTGVQLEELNNVQDEELQSIGVNFSQLDMHCEPQNSATKDSSDSSKFCCCCCFFFLLLLLLLLLFVLVVVVSIFIIFLEGIVTHNGAIIALYEKMHQYRQEL
jgi:hypothetical protein